MNYKKAYDLELRLWESLKVCNKEDFLEVVSEDAVMVCGGERCTGKEYGEMIPSFDCKAFKLDGFELINNDENSFQVHYVVTTEVSDERNADLAGKFHVTTKWKYQNDNWKVTFNMDQRIYS